jgi:RNA polymerase sigma-70 factor (ECF subfamily)
MANEDARHVGLTLKGDRDAYRALVDKYWRVIAILAYQKLGDRGDAEDVAQETFLRAYRSLGRLKDPAKFFRWVVRISRRVTLDRLRARRRNRMGTLDGLAAEFEPEATTPSAAALVVERDQAARALVAIGRLPERYRVVLTLRYLVGHEPKRIAAILGEPDGTIRNRIFRGLDRLRRMLDDG